MGLGVDRGREEGKVALRRQGNWFTYESFGLGD